ncbi:MAG: ABC transporter permease [Candidatus Xenobiia bacterium LiM19]
MVALSLAQKNVTRKQERSFLTIVGVILAVGSFVALLSVAEGLHHRLNREVNGRKIDIYILPSSTIPLPTGPIGAIGFASDVIYVMHPIAIDPKKPPSQKVHMLKFLNLPPVPEASDTSKWAMETREYYSTFPEGISRVENIKCAIGITRFQQKIHGKMIIIWGIPFKNDQEQNFIKAFFPNFHILGGGMMPQSNVPPDESYCTGGIVNLEELNKKAGRKDEKGDITPIDDENLQAVMGEKLAQELHMKVSDTLTLKQGSDNINFNVSCIGRFNAGFQDYFCFIPAQTALSIEDSPGRVKEVWIQVEDRSKLKETKTRLKSLFPDLTIQTSEEYLGSSSELVKYAWIMQFAIALIGILIATTASMNTMLMSTFERIREFGALRAIGASRMSIIMMIFIESLILSITGGVIGIIVGLLGSRFLDGAVMVILQASFPIAHITLNLVMYALLLSLMIGVIGALIPAVIVYKIDIIRAMRWE